MVLALIQLLTNVNQSNTTGEPSIGNIMKLQWPTDANWQNGSCPEPVLRMVALGLSNAYESFFVWTTIQSSFLTS